LKKRGLEVLNMVKSHWVYKRLRNFRAGIVVDLLSEAVLRSGTLLPARGGRASPATPVCA
jgi:hypothetical protein